MKNKHFWIMLACCLVPLVGLAAVWFWGVPLSTVGIAVLLLVCPLSHLFLMRGMGHGKTATQTSQAGKDTTKRDGCGH